MPHRDGSMPDTLHLLALGTRFIRTIRIVAEEEAMKDAKREPPAAAEVRAAMERAGCTVVGSESVLHGTLEDGSVVTASRYPSGWFFTGGPRNLLNFGAPDAAALARFPDTLASVQDHARTLRFTPRTSA